MTTMMPDVSATSVPAYGRRPVLTTVTAPRPTSLAGVYRAAARLIAAHGHNRGDYVADPFDRVLHTPHRARPMSIVAAIRCAVTGDPHRMVPLSERAVSVLAGRLEISEDDPVVYLDRPLECEIHVDDWGDVEGRTAESVCAVLYAAADAVEVTA